MTVRTFETTATDPYERGLELGRGCSDGVRTAWQRYRELWAAFAVAPAEVQAVGAAVLEPIAAFSPSLRAEIAGIAAGAGLAEWQVGALNARSELLALGDQRLLAAGRLPGAHAGTPSLLECSTLVRLPDGGAPVTAQTWDWHTPLTDSWFVCTLRLPGGRQVRTLTEYGIVGKIGVGTGTVAAAGVGRVGVHFNALRHRADSGRGGVPVHVVARRILDEADTGADAVAIAGEADVSASAAVTVTARTGAGGDGWGACTLELHPDGPSVQRSSPGRAGQWLAHTNHFVALDADPEAGLTTEVSTSCERLDRVARLADAGADDAADPQRIAEQLATHDLGERSVCVHGFPDAPVGQRSATLAVVVAEPGAGRLHVHAGRPCDARPGTWWSG